MNLKREFLILLGIGLATAVVFGPLWWRAPVPCLVGDMTARAQGRVPEEAKTRYLDAARMKFGFGSAAIGGWEGLGDALAVNGQVWLRTTHPASPKYFAAVSNRYFQSNGFLYLPHDRDGGIAWRVEQSIELAELWNALAARHPEGVMFSGYLRLEPLQLMAMARAATDGRPVRPNAAYYYTRPMETAPEAWAYVTGFAVARAAVERRDRRWLALLLPARPGQAGAGNGMAYGLWLADTIPVDEASLARAQVRAVGQLVADSTRVLAGELTLFPLTRVGECGRAALVP